MISGSQKHVTIGSCSAAVRPNTVRSWLITDRPPIAAVLACVCLVLLNIVDPDIQIPGSIDFSNLRPVKHMIVYVPYYTDGHTIGVLSQLFMSYVGHKYFRLAFRNASKC
jgi:hypothetical protein